MERELNKLFDDTNYNKENVIIREIWSIKLELHNFFRGVYVDLTSIFKVNMLMSLVRLPSSHLPVSFDVSVVVLLMALGRHLFYGTYVKRGTSVTLWLARHFCFTKNSTIMRSIGVGTGGGGAGGRQPPPPPPPSQKCGGGGGGNTLPPPPCIHGWKPLILWIFNDIF